LDKQTVGWLVLASVRVAKVERWIEKRAMMLMRVRGPALIGRAALRIALAKEHVNMAKYLFEARYTAEGAKGVAREGGTGRRAAITKMTESVGGKLETFYYAFGDVDAYVIVDVPDNVSAAAVALAVNQAGTASVKTVVLIPPEDMDKAGKTAVDYRPPGR
jgi:uncharacterized protein with GYD domain